VRGQIIASLAMFALPVVVFLVAGRPPKSAFWLGVFLGFGWRVKDEGAYLYCRSLVRAKRIPVDSIYRVEVSHSVLFFASRTIARLVDEVT